MYHQAALFLRAFDHFAERGGRLIAEREPLNLVGDRSLRPRFDDARHIPRKPKRLVGIVRGVLRHLVRARALDQGTQVNAEKMLGRRRRDPCMQQLNEIPAETAIRSWAVGRGGEHLETKRALEAADPGLRRPKARRARITGVDQHP